jgi:hypothetical protein
MAAGRFSMLQPELCGEKRSGLSPIKAKNYAILVLGRMGGMIFA